MSLETIYPFNDALNYTFDSNKIEISGGNAQLKLEQQQINFQEDFDSDTGFIYDAAKAEFTGGQVQQKDTRPADATFYASYTNNINGSWGSGVLTGTPTGGASVSGGRLDLAQNDVRYVDYDADLNADSQQTGTIRFRVIPNYNGSPASTQIFFRIDKAAGDTNNNILIFHKITGQLRLRILDSIGGNIIDVDLGVWSPTALTQYEFELNYDITTGATRFFIDGTQFGATQVGTGTRDSNISLVRIGSDTLGVSTSNFFIEDIIIYSAVQHTTNYIPDWSNIYETIFLESNVTLPEFEHTGVGTIISFDSFSTIETNAPRYTIQIGRSGDYLYWDGAAWSVSDNSYSQANDATTFNANIATLPVLGEIYGQFRITFPDSNSQSATAQLNALVTEDKGYYTDDPSIEVNSSFRTDELISYLETSIKTNSEIKAIIKQGSAWYYWDGAAWIESNQTYAQSNTATEIQNNISSFPQVNALVKFKWFLHSDDGQNTPILDNVRVTYSYAGEDADTINICTVWGYYRDLLGVPSTFPILITLTEKNVTYKTNTQINNQQLRIIPNSLGYWEVDLIENINMSSSAQYIFTFNDKNYTVTVPNQSSASFNDLV